MLLTWLYVAHEISFDTFRPGADRTYRVLRQLTTPYKMDYQIDTHGALTPKMIESIAEIESANRCLRASSANPIEALRHE